MRAEKRKKNAPKELARLKQALNLDKKGEAVMTDVQEIATVVPADKIKKQADVDMAEVAEGDGEWLLQGVRKAVIYLHFSDLVHLCLLCYRWEDGHGQQAQQENTAE